MTNKQIAKAFDQLASLMELHEEDSFRIRSYRNAYLALRKADRPLAEMSDAEIKAIKGVGPAIAAKIRELLETGDMKTLQKYRDITPPGVIEMLDIGGFGPGKVRAVWKEMGVESPGELWYACNENRLVAYKGFGDKTQEDLRNKLDFFQKSKGKLRLDVALDAAERACRILGERLPGAFVAPVGEARRRCPTVTRVEALVGYNADIAGAFDTEALILERQDTTSCYFARLSDGIPVLVHRCMAETFGSRLFELTGSEAFVSAFVGDSPQGIGTMRAEHDVFERFGRTFVAPELRESGQWATGAPPPELLTDAEIRGVVHAHTTWSDGSQSLRQMCEQAIARGYTCLGVTDHSQSAFYANGLKPDRVRAQWEEIDALNAELAPFRIFKGIESDILYEGNLDYDDALLEGFDFVIASVHSRLRMDRDKATARILRAIAHPATTILGHPTGRLLLSREGYDLDWDAVFEACALHRVAIELNANPYRLDLDWTLIPRAIAAGVKIAINPDAHSAAGIDDIRYGVMIARKGGMTAADLFRLWE